MSAFQTILNKHRATARSQRDKGDRFERLIQAYLKTDPKYHQLDQIWLWSEFPFRDQLGSHDVGIDLVAKTLQGEYWAIQCKCYEADHRIDKAEVDSFLSTSGRSFKEAAKAQRFAQRLWVSTTNVWSSKAEETLRNQTPSVTRINLTDLAEAPVDWSAIDKGVFGEKARAATKELFDHQREAVAKVEAYFKENDRGKLIMACGTGKTFTALRIAERQSAGGVVLFLVPSIALLGQTLREWTADASEEINAIAICSDAEITRERKKNHDTGVSSTIDLTVPASTNVDNILDQFEYFRTTKRKGLTVVFSTYQSIEVVAEVQRRLTDANSPLGEFDLIVCDEAHRTTGVTLAGDDDSHFVKVHENSFIKAKKRLYMTATPRLYGDESKKRAAEASATIASMDDSALYGDDIHHIGFGEAVERDLLADYKVLILTLSETDVTPEVQKVLENTEHEISTDDASKLIGCMNALAKQILGETGTLNVHDPEPMRRAVAFTSSIKHSKKISDSFNHIAGTYKDSVPEKKRESMVNTTSRHIDGTMSATERDELMSWLKEEAADPQEARVLSNVRCLSEGVDVPSLDAVMFLSARNSQVDVVQSVGRVMRKSPGKQYGYIIIPIVVPSGVTPEEALNDNERYKVVWTVLNALRAHDDRFSATINKIDLNKNRPEQILVGRPDPDGDGDPFNDPQADRDKLQAAQQVQMHFEKLYTAIYAKMVQRVGDRQYWETWAKSVAEIAERQIERITKIVDDDDTAHTSFRKFVKGLRKNINPSVTEQQAIEMLSQHIITRPVFEALFEGYSFVQHNAVSVSMQHALDAIEAHAVEEEDTKLLEGFYASVRKRAEGIDNAAGKQRIIVELYEKFFKTAFPRMVEQLGIVYTPVEVVDFILHSVNDVLQREFKRSLSDKNVNILDPFTGTGTFITRLLHSGLIKQKDLERKYHHELFANEIVLLAYYIAAVNIENAYHDLLEKDEYETFEGVALTDTFQLTEDPNAKIFSDALAENSERVERQRKSPIQVIVGNPPYSAGQKSRSHDAQNQKYEHLEQRITQTYAASVSAANINKLYDSYIKAFRWSTDRLGKDGGIIAFVSNGAWLDNAAMSGFRKSLAEEFSAVYVFNLRGNQRTSGEMSRREGGKIFGSGSRTPIAITILVKNPEHTGPAKIHYQDIGDYLSRNEKLAIIQDLGSVTNKAMVWQSVTPSSDGDWINQRNPQYQEFTPLYQEGSDNNVFSLKTIGIQSAGDPKVYGSSKNHEPWKGLRGKARQITECLYRPFFKQRMLRTKESVYRPGKWDQLLAPNQENRFICVTGIGGSKAFSALMTAGLADYQLMQNAQCFPLYAYTPQRSSEQTLFREGDASVRGDGVTDAFLGAARAAYRDKEIAKEDLFYYVYGVLHSPDYKGTFEHDLRKAPPRIPLVNGAQNFWAFSKAGRELGELHTGYESVDPYEGVTVSGTQHSKYEVQKMRFASKDSKAAIQYNEHIVIEGIPEEAYQYVVNGRSAIEWVMDRYQVRTDKASGIVNDPNDWATESGNPRYILDLLLSLITVSMESVRIVESLPKLNFTTGSSQ